MLSCADDRELADRLNVAYTTVYRWKRMVPDKYWTLVQIMAEHGWPKPIDVPVTRK